MKNSQDTKAIFEEKKRRWLEIDFCKIIIDISNQHMKQQIMEIALENFS